jgi:cytochrome c-type biogenesis protein CcmH
MPGGEGQAKMAAAIQSMPDDQRQAMIHRMVDGLADRLKTNGADLDGWLRLVRAYRVLDEQDKAKSALADARRNFAADAAATKRIDALAHELGIEG